MIISFMNNDDWVYYRMVENFLNGNFNLDPISAPTFYTQGLLGMLFSKFFGIANLPVLTIFISLITCFLFGYTLNKYYGFTRKISLLLSLFLLFNPFFAYSSIGFMTENYFLFFLVLSLYFFSSFEKTQSNLDFIYLLLTLFIGFMLRQVIMVFPLALSVYYFLSKKYRLSIFSGLFFVFIYSFYTFIFPKTAEMYEKPLIFKHLLQSDYSYALIYGSLIVLTSLLLPLVFSFMYKQIFRSKFRFIIFIFLFGILFYGLNHFYKPMTLSWGEFPYLENIWERTGFYPRGIIGTKYQFRFNYDLYKYWDLVSKILLGGLFSYIIVYFNKKKLIDFNLVFVILYLGLMLLTETFYDRYLLSLVPFIILFLAKNIDFTKFTIVINLAFLVFLGFYTYQFTMDFVLINNYMWNKSVSIVQNERIDPTLIHGNNAWKLNYRNVSRGYLYKFSYDSPDVNEGYRTGYSLEEIKNIDYPLNFFINPKIYLYKKLSL